MKPRFTLAEVRKGFYSSLVKPVFFILYFVCCLTTYADKEDDWMAPPDGFQWPKESGAGFISDSTLKVADLTPKQLNSLRNIWTESEGDTLPSGFDVMKADLHHDGKQELFLCDITGSGTGGFSYKILEPTKDGFKYIGDVGGGIILDKPFNGWLQIECSWRLGGGERERSLLRYIDGQYKVVRREIHNFMDGTVKVENE